MKVARTDVCALIPSGSLNPFDLVIRRRAHTSATIASIPTATRMFPMPDSLFNSADGCKGMAGHFAPQQRDCCGRELIPFHPDAAFELAHYMGIDDGCIVSRAKR